MAKRSQKRPMQHGKYQGGCMWGLISMFDFRHNRTTQRLLSDRRHDGSHAEGATNLRTELNAVTDCDEKPQGVEDGEGNEAATTDVIKTSVKELMKEAMIHDESSDKQINTTVMEQNPSNSEFRGNLRKHCRQIDEAKKKFSNMHVCDMDAASILGTESSSYQVAKQNSANNVDLEVLVKELYHQTYQKGDKCLKGDRHDFLDIHSNKANSVLKEQLSAAVELLADHKFTSCKHLAKDGKIQHSEELMDALQPLMKNKEMFLKLVEDLNPPFKHIKKIEDAHLDQGSKSRLLAGLNSLERDLRQSKSDERNCKKHSFLRRKGKSRENFPLQVNEAYEGSSRITILKPGPANSRNYDTDTGVSKSLQSHCAMQDEIHSDRNVGKFSFSEIKRRLKHVMTKEQYRVPSDCLSRRFPYEHKNFSDSESYINMENGGWYHPNRNHFYIEKYAKTSIPTKRREKIGKPLDSKTVFMNEITRHPKHGISNIYVEAKKHISEMLSNGNEEAQVISRQLPRTLGRCLELPSYNFSPSCNLVNDGDNSYVTSHMNLSPQHNLHVFNENDGKRIKESHTIHQSPSLLNLENQSCFSVDNLNEKVQSPDSHPEFNHDHLVEGILSSAVSKIGSEGVLEIVRISDSGHQDARKMLDVSPEPSSGCIIDNVQDSDPAIVCNGEKVSLHFELDSVEPNPSMSSSMAYPSSSSVYRKLECPEIITDRTERPSPISVLEPLFTEDNISPTSTTDHRVDSTIQPQKIHFDEWASATSDQGNCITCMDDYVSEFEYVEAVLLGSDLNWDEFLLRWILSDHIIDPSVFDEVDLFPRTSHDRKLLFYCTNEVLVEVCEHYFGCFPGLSLVKQQPQPVPKGIDLINEVWKRVEWHLLKQPTRHSLNRLVKKDMENCDMLMGIRSGIEYIGREMEKVILEELIEDTMLKFASDSLECEFSALLDKLNKNKGSFSFSN